MADDMGREPSFVEAMGKLAEERSQAEQGAAALKAHAPDDIAGRQLYAEAKAAFDGLIEQLLADLAQNHDPSVSGRFADKLDIAVDKRVAFSRHAAAALEAKHPEGAKSIVAALAQVPAALVKELFAGGIAIWRAWHGAGKERREQIATRLEAQRWKPFAEIRPAA